MSAVKDYFTEEESRQLETYQEKMSEASTPLGVLIYALKSKALIKKVKTEQSKGLRKLSKTENNQTTQSIQVQVGDTIVFRNGNTYKVKSLSIGGAISFSVYYLESQATFTMGKEKTVYYNTLRELNYVLQKDSHLIQEVIPLEFTERTREYSKEECHSMALDWDSRLQMLKEMGILVKKNK